MYYNNRKALSEKKPKRALQRVPFGGKGQGISGCAFVSRLREAFLRAYREPIVRVKDQSYKSKWNRD